MQLLIFVLIFIMAAASENLPPFKVLPLIFFQLSRYSTESNSKEIIYRKIIKIITPQQWPNTPHEEM